MAQEFNRFDLVRKGYDPLLVEREINAINAELVRLTELLSTAQIDLKEAQANLLEAQQIVAQTKTPNFLALGSRAAAILANAQLIATELEQESRASAIQIMAQAELSAAELGNQAEANYEATALESHRRASRIISVAEAEARQIIELAAIEALSLTRATEIQNSQARGLAATEVAALKSTTRRELELRRVELEADHLAKVNLITDQMDIPGKLKQRQLASLEAALASRRLSAEQDYQSKHQEAVATTEGYLQSAINDLGSLTQSSADLRLEIETLELQASKTQRTILQEARDKAEALIHAAEVESRSLTQLARSNAKNSELAAQENLTMLQNQAGAIETYLENLRNLVTEQLDQGRQNGTAH